MTTDAETPSKTPSPEHHEGTLEHRFWQRPVLVFDFLEDIGYVAVALFLLALAVYVLYHTLMQFTHSGYTYAVRTSDVLNGILLVIILAEILRTVVSHLENAGFQLKSFLIIGVISGVRHILIVGAQLSLGVETGATFLHSQIELGVSAGTVIVLVVALLLVRMSDADKDSPD